MKQLIFSVLVLFLAFSACRSDYEKTVAAELAKGERHDAIWLGFSFGMPQKMFFDSCWALNQRGVLSHGSESPTTTCLKLEGFSKPAAVNFFPEFENGAIESFFAVFVWTDWSPWMTDLTQEKLLTESARWIENQLPGNKFIEIVHPEKGKLLVKVDGNRQVLLFPFKEQKVKALITDLSKKKNDKN